MSTFLPSTKPISFNPWEKAASAPGNILLKDPTGLSSTLSNSCGLGKRILHAIPDLAWNFYAISVRPGHERNLMTADFAAYSSDRITEGEDRFWVQSSGPGLEFSGFGEIMCPERYN